MLTDKHMTTLRKIAVRLRELKPHLNRMNDEITAERILLPERQWRSGIDDEMIEASVALDMAVASIDEAVDYLGDITGEDKVPGPYREPPPFEWPTDAEVDAKRREAADAIRRARDSR